MVHRGRFGRLRRRLLRILLRMTVLAVFAVGAALVGFRVSALWRERVADKTLVPGNGRVVATAAGDLFVQEAGPSDGPVVMLVNGTAAWSELWQPTIAALADAGYRAIAVDLPPFGFSPREEGAAYSTPDQALRLTELVQAMHLDNIVLVGHSIGAKPALVTAWRMQDWLRGLVLVDAPLDPPPAGRPPPPPAKSWVGMLLGTPLLGEAVVSATVTNPILSRWLVEQVVADPAAATPARLAVLQRPMVRRGTTASVTAWLRQALVDAPRTGLNDRQRYAALNFPVLLIWGAEDRITPVAQGRRLQGAFPDARLTVLPGSGHLPQLEHTGPFNEALVAWLRTLPPRDATDRISGGR